jgi:hypothetical protein
MSASIADLLRDFLQQRAWQRRVPAHTGSTVMFLRNRSTSCTAPGRDGELRRLNVCFGSNADIGATLRYDLPCYRPHGQALALCGSAASSVAAVSYESPAFGLTDEKE